MVIFLILLGLIFLVLILGTKRFKNIVKIFERSSVIVCGLRGSGKDMLMSNVCAYRNCDYIGNVSYISDEKKNKSRRTIGKCYPFSVDYISLGGNTYTNFLDNNLKPYIYPFSDKVDYYISDAGLYFPSQEQAMLCKRYPSLPLFQALLRQLGDSNFHCNVQNLNRLWDKIREQSDIYIRCISCKVLFGIVFQRIIVYDNYDSCVHRVKPFKAPIKFFGKSKIDIALEKQRYNQTYGSVKAYNLIYIKKSSYDSRRFKKILEEGGDVYEAK